MKKKHPFIQRIRVTRNYGGPAVPKNIAKLFQFVAAHPGLNAQQLKEQKCPQHTRLKLAEQAGFLRWADGWYVD